MNEKKKNTEKLHEVRREKCSTWLEVEVLVSVVVPFFYFTEFTVFLNEVQRLIFIKRAMLFVSDLLKWRLLGEIHAAFNLNTPTLWSIALDIEEAR